MDKHVIAGGGALNLVHAYFLTVSGVSPVESAMHFEDGAHSRSGKRDATAETIRGELRHPLFGHGCIMPEKS